MYRLLDTIQSNFKKYIEYKGERITNCKIQMLRKIQINKNIETSRQKVPSIARCFQRDKARSFLLWLSGNELFYFEKFIWAK